MISQVENTMIAKQLFDILRGKLSKSPSHRVFVVELETIKDKTRFRNIMTHLEKKKFITYEVAFSIVMINITEKGVLRINNHDSW